MTNLILKESTAERPTTSKHKVELIQVLGAVRRGILGREQALEQVAQHLHVSILHNRSDLFESMSNGLDTRRHVLVE